MSSHSLAALTQENSALPDPFAGILGKGSASDSLWLGRRAPRYTSYPPATVFQETLTAEAYRHALASLPTDVPVSLYLHVPFCRALCLYCGCHTAPTNNHERVNTYLFSLQKEITHLAQALCQRRVTRIHFGGGSPNMMSEKDMGLVIGTLAQQFDLSGLKEMAMELDPRLITQAQVRTLKLLGFSRVSLGIQDFNPDVQKAIGRVHSYSKISQACFLLREAGISRINFDLMYGLPLQSPASVADTARLAATLQPDRIALFSYAHMPHIKKHQQALEAYVLPGPHTALAMENAARAALVDEGYQAVGMDHFALPEDSLARAQNEGRLRRSFQGYTDDDAPLLGLGASSIGQLPELYVQNTRATDDYQRQIAKDGLASTRGKYLTAEDKFRGAIIQNLMTTFGVNLESLCLQTGFSLASLSGALDRLAPLQEAGLVRREGGKVSLATPHRMAIRAVAAAFDLYLPQEEGSGASKIV